MVRRLLRRQHLCGTCRRREDGDSTGGLLAPAQAWPVAKTSLYLRISGLGPRDFLLYEDIHTLPISTLTVASSSNAALWSVSDAVTSRWLPLPMLIEIALHYLYTGSLLHCSVKMVNAVLGCQASPVQQQRFRFTIHKTVTVASQGLAQL